MIRPLEIINKKNKLEFAVASPQSGSDSSTYSRSKWNLEIFGFVMCDDTTIICYVI